MNTLCTEDTLKFKFSTKCFSCIFRKQIYRNLFLSFVEWAISRVRHTWMMMIKNSCGCVGKNQSSISVDSMIISKCVCVYSNFILIRLSVGVDNTRQITHNLNGIRSLSLLTKRMHTKKHQTNELKDAIPFISLHVFWLSKNHPMMKMRFFLRASVHY